MGAVRCRCVLERSAARRRATLRVCLAVATAATAATTALSCGGTAGEAPIAGAIASVTERDFHISAPAHLKAGEVDLRVHNEGPDQHELIVVPAAAAGAASLPIRKDGLTIDEEALESSEPGSLDPGEPGSVRDLEVNLRPGRYVLFCNMEGHFMGGMHTEVLVSR